MESFSSAISFSYITWQNSSGPTAFNVHMSKVTFQHCTLEHVNFQFTGLNTNLLIQNTAVSHCSSQSTEIPLFFMQILYNYSTSIFIQNSTFSYNKSPIIYAMQFQEIFIEDTLFLKNGKDISSSPLLTVSGSSVILKNSIFNHTLGTAIEVKNVKNFKASKVVFLCNNGSTGSCLVVKRHSNVSLVDTIFKQNTNPVVFVKDNDGINILLKVWFISCFAFTHFFNYFQLFQPSISSFPSFFDSFFSSTFFSPFQIIFHFPHVSILISLHPIFRHSNYWR